MRESTTHRLRHQERPPSDAALTRYLFEIDQVPLLDRAKEIELVRNAQAGDRGARDRLISAHLRFVVRVAKQYHSYRFPLPDLISEGNIGLMRAIEGFDPDRGNRFLTYAVWRVRQSIHKAICDKSRMIRLPAHRVNKLMRLRKAMQVLETGNNREPTVEQLAGWLQMDPIEARDLIESGRDEVSLDIPAYSGDTSVQLSDIIAAGREYEPEPEALATNLRDDINRALQTLSPRQADVVERRFGLNGKRHMSLKELGRKYNLSSERIRQIENEALQRLRLPSRSRFLEEYLTLAS